jgi:hypothetical protein
MLLELIISARTSGEKAKGPSEIPSEMGGKDALPGANARMFSLLPILDSVAQDDASDAPPAEKTGIMVVWEEGERGHESMLPATDAVLGMSRYI